MRKIESLVLAWELLKLTTETADALDKDKGVQGPSINVVCHLFCCSSESFSGTKGDCSTTEKGGKIYCSGLSNFTGHEVGQHQHQP